MIPEIDNLAPNFVRVIDSENRSFWFSYSTCVAFQVPGKDPLVRENAWGPTTGKHLNAIDGGGKNAKAARVPGDKFKRAIEFYVGAVPNAA